MIRHLNSKFPTTTACHAFRPFRSECDTAATQNCAESASSITLQLTKKKRRDRTHYITWMPVVDDKNNSVPPRVVAGLVLEAGVKNQGLAILPRPLLLPDSHPAVLRYIHPCEARAPVLQTQVEGGQSEGSVGPATFRPPGFHAKKRGRVIYHMMLPALRTRRTETPTNVKRFSLTHK